ncbi:MAG: hypothetical protein F4X27_02925, partial [Chloroflexi bacterium]|nr:hypothetical protein [Chloroflexota bacterium]
MRVKIGLSPGLTFAGTPQAPSGTTFDPATGIWDVGAMSRGGTNSYALPVAVTLTSDSLTDIPLEERCVTAQVVRAVPWFAFDSTKRENDVATACLGEWQKALLTEGRFDLVKFYPCIGRTSYPCTSADTLELVTVAPGSVWQPDELILQIRDPEGRNFAGGKPVWSTASAFDLRNSQTILTSSWSVAEAVTVTAPGGGDAPGRWVMRTDRYNILEAADSSKDAYEFYRLRVLGPSPGRYFADIKIDFSALGTYEALYEISGRLSGATYTDTGTYTFHVGPVADLEVRAAWDAPGVLTLTALNHGPDDASAGRGAATPPPGLRFARSEASQGSYANGVWDIGALKTPHHRSAEGLPEGATLTIYTEPAANTGTPNQMITASIEAEDYCVRIKTSDPSAGNDQECAGALPSGYTEHSTAYYDHRPRNNRVTLPADWTATQVLAAARLTGLAFTSQGGYQPGDDIEVTATFNNDVTVAGQPRLRLRVGEITREAALHSHSYDTVVFRYRVQEGDSDAVDGVSIPPSPIALPQGAGISGPGGGRVSLFFAGLPDDPAHKVYSGADRVEGSNAPVWSPAEDLYTGVEGARYRLADRMRHYYRWNETTRRWEVEFRIADAGLDAPDQNLIQWLILRASGYYLLQPHLYGAAPVEMKPWLGGWDDHEQVKQQLCMGLKAEFSPGKTRGQRLEELGRVSIERIGYVGFGEYGVTGSQDVRNLLRSARDITADTTCPDPPTGMVTIQGQPSTRGEFGAVLYDPNGVVQGSETWQWKRSPEGTTFQDVGYTGFRNIPGATGSIYAPGPEDAGRYLRVKATYTDGQAQRRTAWGQSEGPVPDQPQGAPPPPQPARQTVAADSPLVPEGMGPGD